MEILAVIPARFASTRLPGKPLRDLGGRPLVVRVWEAVRRARKVARVVVATDDERIAEAIEGAGGEAMMTSAEHPSGTDRVAEAVRRLGAQAAVNIQGDEPFLEPEAVDTLAEALEDGAPIVTLREQIGSEDEWRDPSVVKVVCDERGRALYFTRAPIPGWLPTRAPEEPWRGAWRHLGVFGYTREALTRWASLPPSPLEMREGLEQLRPLEAGLEIRVLPSPCGSYGVDTEEQLEEARRRWDEMRS
jgi:3-deoxy-manno-octulosonate cytidylyltransferase (CMP-KDO synthetase)